MQGHLPPRRRPRRPMERCRQHSGGEVKIRNMNKEVFTPTGRKLVLLLLFNFFSIVAQPFAENLPSLSPQSVLQNAEYTTSNSTFIEGQKAHLISDAMA